MEAKRGDRVSLNKLKRLFFFQGDGGLDLSEGIKEMDVIPKTATDLQLEQINKAIRAEHLIIGWPETKAEGVTDNDSDIKELILLGRGKIEKWVKDLVADKTVNPKFKSYKIETLLSMENAGKKRVGVIEILEQQLRYIGGISRIEEGEQEKVVIKLTQGNGTEEEVENN